MKLLQRVDPPTTRGATAGTNAKPHPSRLTGLFGVGDAGGGERSNEAQRDHACGSTDGREEAPEPTAVPVDAAEDCEGFAAFRFHAAKRSKNYADSERTHDPNRK